MINGLQFCYLYHDYDVIEIRIIVGNGRFHASANAYVQAGGLSEAAATLDGFPTNASDARELVFGAFGAQSAGGAVRLQLSCWDLAGHARIRATVEDDYRSENDTESAIVFIDFEPAALDEFVSALRHLEIDLKGCAELAGLPHR
jgi:hypothetical protein